MRPFASVVTGAILALAGVLALAPTSGCSSSTAATDNGVKCTPGNYVFCRCQDRQEGTKLCNPDGHSFGKCEPCETDTNPSIPDEPGHPPPEVDAGGDKDVEQPVTAKCGDKLVQDGEDCDDGNMVDDDGCDSDCHLAGSNPTTSRSCPGLETHVWSKPVTYIGTTVGSTNTGSAKPTCTSTMGGNPTTGAAGPDRVFKITAHKTGKLTVTTTDTNYDCFVYVTDTCTPASDGSLGYLACANNVNGVGGETLSVPVTAGKSYSVLVDGAGISQQQGAFRVTFAIQ